LNDPHFGCACCGGLMRQAWSRRQFLAAASAGAVGLMTPRFACAEDVPSIAYESVPDLLHLPPDLYLGEVSGVALNSAGHIFVLHRGSSTGPAYAAAAAQLLEFDRNGNYLREIGHNLYAWSFAHTVKVDREDNVWVTDKGSDMVIKFTPEGRVDMVFGRKQEAADEDTAPLKHLNPPLPARDGYFRQVTDVAWDSAGDAFISDGYINSRVAKVSKDGGWLKSWGERGTAPGQFHTPHSIAVDANGLVYVADRSNRRIQVFDGEGAFQRQFTIDAPVPAGAEPAIGDMPGAAEIAAGTFAAGAPWAICLSPPPNQVLYAADGFPGRIYKLTLDGKLLGTLGRSGKRLKQFGWIHEMTCPEPNVLFVAELLNWRVQKLLLAG
jgi:NHL repeat